MTIVSMTSYKEAKDKEKAELLRHWRRVRSRYLGGTVRHARDYHQCDRCIFSIQPGDLYRRDVYANNVRYAGGRKYLRIEKHHWPQCYGPSEEEDREMRDMIEREREAEKAAERTAA